VVRVNLNNISLYQDAKAGLSSLVKQTSQVFIGLMVMLLLTGGEPPALTVALSCGVGVGFVAWSEKKRLVDLRTSSASNKSEADLTEKSAKFADLPSNVPQSSDLREAYFRGANLRGVNFSGVKLSGANLRLAILRGAADLSGADLSRADLILADLSGANLSKANLSEANLSVADLREANLSGADFSEATVTNTIFANNLGISDLLKSDLIERGAKFVDSLGETGDIPTRV
jgi:uncharacterized protein YjbI with pentapeptide repeats